MSKRFPIPEFDRDKYKNRDWNAPKLLSAQEQRDLIAAAAKGDSKAYGCYPVQVDQAFLEAHKLKGSHTHAVMCLTPKTGARITGRSWAWPIQRALVVDSLDPARSKVLQDWTTPRPMNTRLGPDNGEDLAGGVAYIVVGHKYADHWIVNRTLVEPDATGGKGFSVLSASDEQANDFHACNIAVSWK